MSWADFMIPPYGMGDFGLASAPVCNSFVVLEMCLYTVVY